MDQHVEVGTYNGDETVNFAIALQDVREDLTVGVHNVTMLYTEPIQLIKFPIVHYTFRD